MKFIITLIIGVALSVHSYSQNISTLLGSSYNDYPSRIEGTDLYVIHKNQIDTIIYFLEDRIDLKKRLYDLLIDKQITDISLSKMQDLSSMDKKIINSLVSTNEIKEKQTLSVLKGVESKVNTIDVFLGEEKKKLLSQNKKLKRAVWLIVPTSLALLIISNL